jgi:AAA domain
VLNGAPSGAIPLPSGPADRFNELFLPRSALDDLKRGEPLINGVIDRHTLFVVSGRDDTFKSFLVLDWLCCLTTGKDWLLGCTTPQRQRVLYVVGEGAWGLGARVRAW